jgi:hypothetical protein
LNNEQKYIFAEDESNIDAINLLKDFKEFTVVIHHHRISEIPLHIDTNKFQILSEYNAVYNVDAEKYFVKCFKLKRF